MQCARPFSHCAAEERNAVHIYDVANVAEALDEIAGCVSSQLCLALHCISLVVERQSQCAAYHDALLNNGFIQTRVTSVNRDVEPGSMRV